MLHSTSEEKFFLSFGEFISFLVISDVDSYKYYDIMSSYNFKIIEVLNWDLGIAQEDNG